MTDLIKTPDNKLLSRRDFLKTGGIAAGSMLLAATQVDKAFTFGAVINTITNPDSSVTVNERKQKLKEVVVKSVSEPKLLGSFLKFMALEVYANTQGYIVAKNAIRQFLYGNGKDLDITNLLVDSFRKSPEWLDGKFDSVLDHDQKVLEAFSVETFKRSIAIKEHNPKKLDIKFDKEGNRLHAKGFSDPLNADTFYGLNKFSFVFDGRVTDDTISGKYQLSDRYDWDDRHSEAGSLTNGAALDIACEMLSYLGISNPKEWIVNLVGEEEFSEIASGRFVRIDDEDGLRLQNSGVGIPFNITASWEVTSMRIDIPEKLIK